MNQQQDCAHSFERDATYCLFICKNCDLQVTNLSDKRIDQLYPAEWAMKESYKVNLLAEKLKREQYRVEQLENDYKFFNNNLQSDCAHPFVRHVFDNNLSLHFGHFENARTYVLNKNKNENKLDESWNCTICNYVLMSRSTPL